MLRGSRSRSPKQSVNKVTKKALPSTRKQSTSTLTARTNSKKAPVHTNSKRNISDSSSLGFSYPVSKKLDGIVNMELFATQTPETIDQIWGEYHAQSSTAYGTTISKAQYDKITERAPICEYFTIPLFRDAGHFVMLSQYQDKSFLFTYLDDYKKDPSKAQPYLTVTLYDEFKHTKDRVLVRADICALQSIDKSDSERLTRLIIDGYSDDTQYPFIYAFNKTPDTFDFDQYMKLTV